MARARLLSRESEVAQDAAHRRCVKALAELLLADRHKVVAREGRDAAWLWLWIGTGKHCLKKSKNGGRTASSPRAVPRSTGAWCAAGGGGVGARSVGLRAEGRSSQTSGHGDRANPTYGLRLYGLRATGVPPPQGRFGTMRMASPSRTGLSPTRHTQSKRARRLAGISSTIFTLAMAWSPIRTGARKFSVCET